MIRILCLLLTMSMPMIAFGSEIPYDPVDPKNQTYNGAYDVLPPYNPVITSATLRVKPHIIPSI